MTPQHALRSLQPTGREEPCGKALLVYVAPKKGKLSDSRMAKLQAQYPQIRGYGYDDEDGELYVIWRESE